MCKKIEKNEIITRRFAFLHNININIKCTSCKSVIRVRKLKIRTEIKIKIKQTQANCQQSDAKISSANVARVCRNIQKISEFINSWIAAWRNSRLFCFFLFLTFYNLHKNISHMQPNSQYANKCIMSCITCTIVFMCNEVKSGLKLK